MVNKSNLPPLSCSLCSFTCRSKPTLLRHKNGTHRSTGSQGLQSKKEERNKKRPMSTFDCTKCQSSFTSKYRLKKHADTQHVEEDIDKSESPPRKTAKHEPELLNETIHLEDEKKESKDDSDHEYEDTIMDDRIKRLLRPKESKNISTNTEDQKHNLETELKKVKQLLTGATEVISNLEAECEDHHKKAEFYKDMSENLVTENEAMILKIKQMSDQKQKLQSLVELQKWKLNNYTVKYNCEECGDIIIKENEIDEHKVIHMEKMQFEEAEITNDNDINKPHASKQHIQQENFEHTRVKYDCDTCGELFFTESEREEHDNMHKDEMQNEEPENLNDIVRNKQSGFERPNPQEKAVAKKVNETTFYCDRCGKQFKNKNILISHMENHNSHIGSHSCSSCMQTFSNKKDLENHMKNHEDGDHNCQDCDLEFNTREALEKHKDIKHLKKSPLNCMICDTQFQMKYQLRNHMTEQHKTHKPCRKFATNKCEFDSECRFNHIILEPNQMICFDCGTIVNDKTLLMKHIEKEHGSTPCNKFASGRCTFGNKCLYRHITNNEPTSKESNETNSNQDFQMSQQNPSLKSWPKIQSPSPNPSQTELIKMMPAMLAMMAQIINQNTQ